MYSCECGVNYFGKPSNINFTLPKPSSGSNYPSTGYLFNFLLFVHAGTNVSKVTALRGSVLAITLSANNVGDQHTVSNKLAVMGRGIDNFAAFGCNVKYIHCGRTLSTTCIAIVHMHKSSLIPTSAISLFCHHTCTGGGG